MDRYEIGIDLGGTNIKAAIFDKEFQKVAEQRMETQVAMGSEHVLRRMHETVRLLLKKAGICREAVLSVGIGVPGLMDIGRGISRFSPNFPDWKDVPVVDWMQERLSVPVYIDNDARVNLYGEWYFGAGIGRQNLLMLTLGTGLGSGAVVNGHVLYGATGSAGEIGHINMYREGRPCRCGSSGCLGRYVSALGMLRTLREKIESGRECVIKEWVDGDLERVTAQMVSRAYDEGDAVARETLRETGELLGFGLSGTINLLNPEMIIIGGGMADAGERLLKYTREAVEAHALNIPRQACRIVTAKLGDAAGMIGAAVYGRKRRESEPVRSEEEYR